MNIQTLLAVCGVVVAIEVILLLIVFLYDPGDSMSAATLKTTTQVSTTTTPPKSPKPPKPTVLSKLIVAMGTYNDNGGILTVEVIDLLKNKTTCQNLPDYPEETCCGGGGLDDNNTVRIYGGFLLNPDNRALVKSRWIRTDLFQFSRAYLSSVQIIIPNTGASNMVTGGVDYSGSPTKSAEILTEKGWEFVTDVPNPIYFHCGVAMNVTTVMLIAGRQTNAQKSNITWVYDIAKDVWSRGIDYVYAVSSHGCGMVKKNNSSESKSIIVIGGVSNTEYIVQTNILHEGATEWINGPQFPTIVLNAVVVEDAWGGALVVGGRDDINNPYSTIYRLATAEDQWVLMTQALKHPRWKHVAFLIPDEYTNCN